MLFDKEEAGDLLKMFKGCCFGSGRAVQDSPDLSDKRRFKSDGGLKDNLNGAAAATPEDCSAKNAVVDSEFADTPGEDSLKEAAPTNDSGGGANSSDQLPAEPEENSHGIFFCVSYQTHFW